MKTTESNAELTPRLICSDLQIGRAGQPLLPPVNLAVRPGEVWVLVGRNGSGKSTLLQTLLGSLKPVGGAYTLARGCRLGHVPQRESHDLCVPARGVDMVESGADRAWGFGAGGAPIRSRQRSQRSEPMTLHMSPLVISAKGRSSAS